VYIEDDAWNIKINTVNPKLKNYMIKMVIPEKFIFTYILIYYTTPSYNIPA